jgi:hypothetical protein
MFNPISGTSATRSYEISSQNFDLPKLLSDDQIIWSPQRPIALFQTDAYGDSQERFGKSYASNPFGKQVPRQLTIQD